MPPSIPRPALPVCGCRHHSSRGARIATLNNRHLWTEDARADGERLPKPRALETLRKYSEFRAALREGAALAIVPPRLDAGRPATANLSLDAELLQGIDEAAEAHGLTRSAFIASAVLEKIVSGG